MTKTVHENPLRSVLNWLRAGYPEGVPTKDYSPMLALLRSALTEQEVEAVIAQLRKERTGRTDVTEQEIKEAIASVADGQPTAGDVHQVAARLAAAGWPLATDVPRD